MNNNEYVAPVETNEYGATDAVPGLPKKPPITIQFVLGVLVMVIAFVVSIVLLIIYINTLVTLIKPKACKSNEVFNNGKCVNKNSVI